MPIHDPTGPWPDLELRRKRLRLTDFDYSDPNHVFFVTLCARHLGQPFLDASLAREVSECLLFRVTRKDWRVFAYCLMPDHLHLALSPEPGKGALSQLLRGYKSYTTRLAWQRGYSGPLWQRSYYDHVARREESLVKICEYILMNPVRKGLVEDAALWPHSGMPSPLPG
ncbi:MAG: transposase [Chloroflexi bacterium]|nr:transposase [Chloroflexota bacterium]